MPLRPTFKQRRRAPIVRVDSKGCLFLVKRPVCSRDKVFCTRVQLSHSVKTALVHSQGHSSWPRTRVNENLLRKHIHSLGGRTRSLQAELIIKLKPSKPKPEKSRTCCHPRGLWMDHDLLYMRDRHPEDDLHSQSDRPAALGFVYSQNRGTFYMTCRA